MNHDPELPGGFQDADFDQAELERAGLRHRILTRKSREALKSGNRELAAALCPHSSGYDSPSLAARLENDPRAGEAGFRCSACYSFLDRAPFWGGARILHACEDRPAQNEG